MRPIVMSSIISFVVFGGIVAIRYLKDIPGFEYFSFFVVAWILALAIGIMIGHFNGIWFAHNKAKGLDEFVIF